jgi:hypothetical protein
MDHVNNRKYSWFLDLFYEAKKILISCFVNTHQPINFNRAYNDVISVINELEKNYDNFLSLKNYYSEDDFGQNHNLYWVDNGGYWEIEFKK